MLTICHWDAWQSYLIQQLAGDAEVLELRVSEGPDALVPRILAASAPPSLVLMHVNLSQPRLPVARELVVRRLGEHGLTVWNGRIGETTKRSIQHRNRALGLPSSAASREGAGDELVIVKDNNNHHAWGESRLTTEERAALGYSALQASPLQRASEYPVMARSAVPAEWWTNDELFIERYVQNREGWFFRVYLVGDRCALCCGRSERPVRRMNKCEDREDYLLKRHYYGVPALEQRLPEALRPVFHNVVKLANALALDYGSLDVVTDDEGQAYVVDVNPTPHWGREGGDQFCTYLSEGLTIEPPVATVV